MGTAAIIVAGGRGMRMQSTVPKQYLKVGRLPIVCHTLRLFSRHASISETILVIPADDFSYCRDHILAPLGLHQTVQMVKGGSERQFSVRNGLAAVDSRHEIVVVHDAVRPFVEPTHITACIDGAEKHGACTLGREVSDTLKKSDADGFVTKTLERENVWHIQTPQAFKTGLLKEAHASAEKNNFLATDDASLVERLGAPVKLIRGSSNNIKITTPEDLQLAEMLFNKTGSESVDEFSQ